MTSCTKTTPRSLTALGGRPLPDSLTAGGKRYTRARTFKNDFFAVTAQYECEGECVLLKVNRQAWFFLLPLGLVGRLLAARECHAMERLRDVDGVPRLIERWGSTGFVREFVEGRPLSKGEHVPDGFHPALRALVAEIHRRGMAYVDLEKCENVLLGEDGKPYLFDFQIAWMLPRRFGGELWPARVLRRWFQAGDRYHLVKLQRRTRPDQLSPEELARSYAKPWYVRWHRRLTWPLTWCRRRILDRVDPKRASGERGRVAEERASEAS